MHLFIINCCVQSSGKKRQKSASDPTAVDSDDVLVDIEILDISVKSAKKNHKDGNCNLDEFFSKITSSPTTPRKFVKSDHVNVVGE